MTETLFIALIAFIAFITLIAFMAFIAFAMAWVVWHLLAAPNLNQTGLNPNWYG